ncbi:MAG: LacI family DNA-binding transcriptional regulator [Alphaproteobacteria bacterium]|nr:LacI family DNA-binding transcriptional regulator [Alphaproteobacteria bacterium]
MSDGSEKRPTLRSLAEITGLGISTVSQALRDSPEIALETRRRVQKAAQQMGYRPNRAGVRLRTGKSNVITVVLNAEDGGSGFFANIVYGISDALKDTPYHLVITPYSLSDPMDPIRYIVETNSADGVIISRTQPDDPRVRYLIENNMPFATHGRTAMGIEHAYFDFNNDAFAFEAVHLLHKHGRKNLVLIGPPAQLNYFHHTLGGFNRGLSTFGMRGELLSTVDTDSEVQQLVLATKALAERRDGPDGIVCVSSSVALATIAGMRQGGKMIGRDYDMVAKPISETIQLFEQNIIGIGEDFRLAGQELARMVMARIAGTEPIVLQMLEHPKV